MPAQSRKAAKDKYAPKVWTRDILVDLEFPSGQLAQVRRPGITGLVKAGVLDSLDSLSSLVKTEHIDRVQKGQDPHVSAQDMADFSQNKEGLVKAVEISDKVALHCVVQPRLSPVPMLKVRHPADDTHFEEWVEEVEIEIEDRPTQDEGWTPDTVYVDQVDLMDKMYLLQFVVGGVTDLEQFRSEFDATVGDLATQQGLQVEAQ